MKNNLILNKLIDELVNINFTEFVFVDSSVKIVSRTENIRIHNETDPRSAAFYSYSLAKQNLKVVLFVREEQLADTYTALTESYMQAVGFVIIAFNSSGYKGTLYLRRCTQSIEEISSLDNVVNILSNLKVNRPLILKTDLKISEKSYDYSNIVNSILKLNPSAKIFAYNTDNNGVINIKPEHASCTLSKYVGYLTGSENLSILIVPDKLVWLDLNIFSIRNFPADFKMIVSTINSTTCSRCRTWLESNGITVLEHKGDISTVISNFLNNDIPQVLFI